MVYFRALVRILDPKGGVYAELILHAEDFESSRRKPSPNVPGGAGYKFGLELQIGQQFARASELHAQIIRFHCSTAGLPVF